ncbi:TetR family transcriptional regulator [Streptomyces sp. NBC_00015]|uniref:ScbR family autoregulator-binding transcription factor n=1 Tax=unclassified Streptomyces TaxID=2593676 RepID=UPI00224D9F2E|nr:ScbR family autoregulator-binding transcription factor [Streptomyces sp. NBC_00103]MCX5372758.1 ScbR family autoregulator-binding transcription factor [Streptomyces sp. NBC_00103]
MDGQGRALRTRRALIQAAAEVFAEEGFVHASLRAISERAGVSSGALHFHFAHKGALAEAVEAEATEVVRSIIRAAPGRPGDVLQTVVDATHALMHHLAQDAVACGGFELAGDISRRANSPLRREWQHWIEESLREAERSGTLVEGVSAADAARVIVVATTGLQVLGSADARWLSAHNVTRFWELVLPRLAAEHCRDRLVCAGSRPRPAPPRHPPAPADLPA